MIIPNQRLTDSQKESEYGSLKEWGRSVINSILNLTGYTSMTGTLDYPEIQNNIDLYNGHINERDLHYVTNPYGLKNAQFPATLQNYNIIKPKVDLLVGEEIKRPFNYKVVALNSDSVTIAEQKKQELVLKTLTDILKQELFAAGMIPPEEAPEQPMTIEQIDKFIETSYSDMREILGQQALDYLTWYCDVKTLFNKGFKGYLTTGNEIYYTGIRNGDPDAYLVDPRHFYAEMSNDISYIEDAQYCYYQRFMTPSDVYDQFYDDLSEEDIDRIESIKNGQNYVTIVDTNLGVPISYADPFMNDSYILNNNSLIRVVHVCWQGLRKVGFLTFQNPETGEQEETIVDETYKPNKDLGESIEWKWVNETWEGTRIGADIFVNVRPVPYQNMSLDNPSRRKLPYTGVWRHQALVSVMKPHQYFYDVMMYRLELSLAKSKDKIMLMDIAQIPRSLGIDTEKWMYYLDTLGVAFINSFEEGTGKFAGKSSSFNNFQSIDMSLANIINQYVLMLNKIEDMIGEISGVSRQRQGEVSSSELVGNVERSVVQSSHITEPMFYIHSEVKRRVLTNLLEAAKVAWKDGKKAQYVTDDLNRIFFSIDGDQFADSEFGIFISNSSKDQQSLDTLKQLAQAALQAGAVTLTDIANILSTDSIAKVKQQLQAADKRAQEREERLQEQQLQAQKEIADAQIRDKEADRQTEIDNNIRDNETKLTIAELSKEESTPDNSQEIANKFQIEREKLNIQREESRANQNLDKDYLNLERDKVNHEKKMKEKEVEIKKIAARNKPKPKSK